MYTFLHNLCKLEKLYYLKYAVHKYLITYYLLAIYYIIIRLYIFTAKYRAISIYTYKIYKTHKEKS